MAKWMNEFVRMAICSVDNPDFLVEAKGLLLKDHYQWSFFTENYL